MNGWPRTVAGFLLLAAAACGSNDSAQPAETNPPSTTVAPATSAPTTTIPATTVPETTTKPTAPLGAPMTVDELTAVLPIVDGYEYSDLATSGIWEQRDTGDEMVEEGGLADLTTSVTRAVFVAGGDPQTGIGWVGEVGVFDAGSDTPQVWMDYVNDHRIFLLAGPPIGDPQDPDSTEPLAVTYNTVNARWQAIVNEIALTGDAEDGDFGAAWFHDGLIWTVSGFETMNDFAAGLVGEQESTGVEPEQIDIDALEGPLADAIVDVPGFQFYDGQPLDVLAYVVEGLGNCVEHLSGHSVVPTEAQDLGIYIWMSGLAAPCREPLDDSTIPAGWTRQDINGVPAVISDDGTEIIIVADTGVTVDVLLQNTDDLTTFAPVLEMFAETVARTEI